MPVPRIAITPGEPAGIGPDLCCMIAQQAFDAELVAVGDPSVLEQRAQALGLPLQILAYEPEATPSLSRPGQLRVLQVSTHATVTPGKLDTSNAAYVVETLKTAARGCLDGAFDAISTAPVHKGVINDAGIPFSGHTELFGEIAQGHPVMMLATDDFRVALATTHLPLSKVSESITAEVLTEVISILHADLKHKFGIQEPRILVCGLNPHAGEGGHLGREEIEVIEPTLNALRTKGLQLLGPLPADTLFTPKYLNQADAVLAMYHDQGLPVLKYAGFGNAVNITLGLRLIRTSVDHGTALDLAAGGEINAGSFKAAICQAIQLANHSRNVK